MSGTWDDDDLEQADVDAITRGQQLLSTETIVMIGLLGALTLFLAVTRLGDFPLPNLTGSATIVHVPTILAGVLGGPAAGLVVGLIFGGGSWVTASVPMFTDPLVAVLPRLFVGVLAYLAWKAFKDKNTTFALGFAGWVGTITNTVLVLTMAILRGYLPLPAVVTIIPQSLAEQVIAVMLTIVVGRAYLTVMGHVYKRARD
jgi:uncharacterized membrane protein